MLKFKAFIIKLSGLNLILIHFFLELLISGTKGRCLDNRHWILLQTLILLLIEFVLELLNLIILWGDDTSQFRISFFQVFNFKGSLSKMNPLFIFTLDLEQSIRFALHQLFISIIDSRVRLDCFNKTFIQLLYLWLIWLSWFQSL